MTLKKKKEPMEIVPMPKNTFKKLIAYLSAIKPLHPDLEPYLEEVMVAKECKQTHDLHLQGKVIDKAYYISYGFMMAYYLDKEGKEHVLKIYHEGEIVAGHSFMNAKPAKYHLKIYKGAFVLGITHAQMETGYRTIPEMDELARLTIASFENKEIQYHEMIRKGGEESVLHLYKTNPGLLPAGKVISDLHIASLLQMSDSNLRRFRKRLLKKGLI